MSTTTDSIKDARLPITRSAHKIIPHLSCSDVEQSAAFYTDCLGFELGGLHLDVPMVSVFMGARAEANIYIFGKAPEDLRPGTVMVGLGRSELEQYYQVLVDGERVEITTPIRDTDWAFRQFDVKDPDGNQIQFFAFLDP